jgi:hypothetical protein
MLKQFKYALRDTVALRLGTLAGAAALNTALFLFAWVSASLGQPRISPVVFSSLLLSAVIGCCIAADFSTFQGVFRPDRASHIHLAPASGAEILTGRVLTVALSDLINLAVGLAGLMAHVFLMNGTSWETLVRELSENKTVPLILSSAIMILFAYLMLTLAEFFARAMRASVFHSVAGGGVLAFLSAAAALYVLSFMDFALLPLGELQRWGPFFNITLESGFNWDMAAFLLLTLVKCAVFFILTARLIERRINL